MGLGFGFGGKGFRVRVSSRGISTRIGKSTGLNYTTYHSFSKGKKRKSSKKQTVKPTVIKEQKPKVSLQEQLDATNAKLNEMSMATKAEKERQENSLPLMKFTSVFLTVISILLISLSLLLTIALPLVGLIGIGLGVVFFVKGNNYSKRVKILKNEELKKQVK